MKALLIVFLIGLAIAPAYAQEDTCQGDAQAWYDAIDPENEITASFTTVMSTAARTSARFGAIEDAADQREAIEALDYPACVEDARAWYIEGLALWETASAAFLDGEVGDFTLSALQGSRLVGQFRGYLAALGVDVYFDEDIEIYFR